MAFNLGISQEFEATDSLDDQAPTNPEITASDDQTGSNMSGVGRNEQLLEEAGYVTSYAELPQKSPKSDVFTSHKPFNPNKKGKNGPGEQRMITMTEKQMSFYVWLFLIFAIVTGVSSGVAYIYHSSVASVVVFLIGLAALNVVGLTARVANGRSAWLH